MAKIKISQEQADALRTAVADYGSDDVMNDHVKTIENWGNDLEPLNQLPPHQLARILYEPNSFEIKFKAMDLVVYADGSIKEYIPVPIGSEQEMPIRHATNQEIWWFNHGRKPWELKRDDILVHKEKGTMAIFCKQIINPIKKEYTGVVELRINPMWDISDETYFTNITMSAIKKYWKVACFA